MLKTKFLKKRQPFQRKKYFGLHFPAIGVWQSSVDELQGSTRFSDNYSGSYNIISLTPKSLLKTQIFENKGSLSSEEQILAFFSRIIECVKPQGTVYEGPQGILTITVEVTSSFL